MQYVQEKPKSWDSLAMKAFGGYGFGYGYLEKSNQKNRANVTSSGTVRAHFLESDSQILYASQSLANNQNQSDTTLPMINQQQQQQHNSVPRKNPSGRYSLLNIENYAPPPSQFVQEFATTTTTSFTKSTDNLLGTYNASNSSINSNCECTDAQGKTFKPHKSQTKDCMGYYSNLPTTGKMVTTKSSTENIKNCESVSTVSEMTRL